MYLMAFVSEGNFSVKMQFLWTLVNTDVAIILVTWVSET